MYKVHIFHFRLFECTLIEWVIINEKQISVMYVSTALDLCKMQFLHTHTHTHTHTHMQMSKCNAVFYFYFEVLHSSNSCHQLDICRSYFASKVH